LTFNCTGSMYAGTRRICRARWITPYAVGASGAFPSSSTCHSLNVSVRGRKSTRQNHTSGSRFASTAKMPVAATTPSRPLASPAPAARIAGIASTT
jgi:hypothetical protein